MKQQYCLSVTLHNLLRPRYTSDRWALYWSSPPSLIFDIWALWRAAQMSKIKDGGLDQYGAQRSEV